MGFLEFPEQWDKLVQDPDGLVASATEEILRWASPVMHLRRNVTVDTELRDQVLKAGDKVSIWYISANRDEEVFERSLPFSTSSDNPTSTWRSAAAVPISAWVRAWREWNFECCSKNSRDGYQCSDRWGSPRAPLRSNVVAGIKHLPVDLSASPVRSG